MSGKRTSNGAAAFVEDATRRIAATLTEVLPPEALAHLLRAQRELLLAVASVIEHNVQRTPTAPPAQPRKPRKKPARVELE